MASLVYEREIGVADVPDITNFEFSYVGNDRRLLQKSGTCQENRNTSAFPDLSPTIPDDPECLRFPVFISWYNLGGSENSEIPDRLNI